MDRRVFDDRRRIGTEKAAVNLYGERILESSSSSLVKPAQMDLPKKSSDLRVAERDLVRYKVSGRAAKSAKGKAESKLSEAERKVKDFALQIEQSNLKVKARMRDVDMLKKLIKHEDKALTVWSAEGHQFAGVIRELEGVKQELRKLKIEMVSVFEEKKRIEKQIASSDSKLSSNMNSVEAIRKKIDKANEEQKQLEFARIEALKEFGEIQAQREKEASEFSSAMVESKKRIKNAKEEDNSSKDLESELAVTLYDVNLLQNETKLAKNMDIKVRNDSMKHLGDSFRKGKRLESSPAWKSITEELHTAEKELASIREEGFQFLTSMNIIRNELRHVIEETVRLQKAKEKADITAQNLNSKLLRAKSKLETAAAVEEKARSILSSLSVTLEQLKTETEVARKEKKLIIEETANIRSEIHKTESQMDLTDRKLQAAIRELQAVKSSESLALENLRNVIEKTMRSRASASQQSSSITILKFEYEYLTGHSAKAEEIADKKVAAAHAWIEAQKASEKEILIRIELAHRDIRDTRVEEEEEEDINRTESSLTAKRMVEGELRKWRQTSKKNTEAENQQQPLPGKSGKANGKMTPSRRSKLRNSGSPAVRMTLTPRSTSIISMKK